MLGKAAGDLLARGLAAIAADATSGKSKINIIFKKIASHPVKVLASFLAAPFLVFKIAMIVKNPIRRAIATIGLLSALVLSYVSATFLGSVIGALFIATHISVLAGIGFLFGTTVSVYLSVIFSIIVFNAVSFVFLKVSSQEIVDYLNEIST
jgi:hypothetical protein